MNAETTIEIRVATTDDIPLLVSHHQEMFREILSDQGMNSETLDSEKLDIEYGEKLRNELGGDCRAWLVHSGDVILSSGAVTILSMVPVPKDCSYKVGYLHSIYTEKTFRKSGLAGRIVRQAIRFCKSRGINRLILNASEAAKPIYEQLGFESVDNHMRLWVKDF